LRKVKALLLGLIVLAVALLPTVSFKSPTVAADPNNDDWLHVEGNKIVTGLDSIPVPMCLTEYGAAI